METKRSICALVAVAVALCAGCASRGPVALKLATYNIHHAEGADRKIDCRRIAEHIVRERPDFAGVNEVDVNVPRSGGIDTPTELAKLTGMHATFAKAIPLRGGEYGNAVLSLEAPLSVLRLPLPGREPRVLLLCEFADCWFGTTHLALQENSRISSVETIEKTIAERCAGKPVFLSGDWNAEPDSKTLNAVRKFATILSKEDSRTFHGFKRYPPAKDHCIDYIAVDNVSAGRVRMKEARVVEDLVSSDHNPVFVSLELSPR